MVTKMRFYASKWSKILSGPIFQPLVTSCPMPFQLQPYFLCNFYAKHEIWLNFFCSILPIIPSYPILCKVPLAMLAGNQVVARLRSKNGPTRCTGRLHQGWSWWWIDCKQFLLLYFLLAYLWTFLLAAGDGGTPFFFEPPPAPEPPLISMLTELFGFTFLKTPLKTTSSRTWRIVNGVHFCANVTMVSITIIHERLICWIVHHHHHYHHHHHNHHRRRHHRYGLGRVGCGWIDRQRSVSCSSCFWYLSCLKFYILLIFFFIQKAFSMVMIQMIAMIVIVTMMIGQKYLFTIRWVKWWFSTQGRPSQPVLLEENKWKISLFYRNWNLSVSFLD